MSNLHGKKEVIYSKTMESFLSNIYKTRLRKIGRKSKWLNVQNAEQKFQSQRKLGKWLVDQTKLENECNLKSVFMNAQNATLRSEKY